MKIGLAIAACMVAYVVVTALPVAGFLFLAKWILF